MVDGSSWGSGLDRRAAWPWAGLAIWAVSGVILVTLSVLYLDRAVSTWSHAELHRPQAAVFITRLAHAPYILGAAALALVAVGAIRWWTGRLGAVARPIMGAAIAAILATLAVALLKDAAGRLWPETWVNHNPSWIGMHRYGFYPFHGGVGYESFPSGHTARVSAPCTVLWKRIPRWRPLWVLIPIAVAAALVSCDFHFLGDCIGGAYLGIAVGAAVLFSV